MTAAKTKHVWLVVGSTGENIDRRSWNVAALPTFKAAMAYKTQLDVWLKKHQASVPDLKRHREKYGGDRVVFIEGWLDRKDALPTNPLDPEMEFDCTGVEYGVEAVAWKGTKKP